MQVYLGQWAMSGSALVLACGHDPCCVMLCSMHFNVMVIGYKYFGYLFSPSSPRHLVLLRCRGVQDAWNHQRHLPRPLLIAMRLGLSWTCWMTLPPPQRMSFDNRHVFSIPTLISARKLIVTNALILFNREKTRVHLRWPECQSYRPGSRKTSCYSLHPPFRLSKSA
jgi:hypothetical protein